MTDYRTAWLRAEQDIRDLEAERDALADALREIAQFASVGRVEGHMRKVARAALDRHTQGDVT
jgi:hypothetical protein